MNEALTALLWVALSWPIVIFMQRWIHRHLHGVAYLLMGNKNWAVLLYALFLFPGVLLHELSHLLTAVILGVKISGFSVLPRQQQDGTIQLGYVEYYRTKNLGPIRESLIGSAPLITGTAAMILIGLQIFAIDELGQAILTGDGDVLTSALRTLFDTQDFLIWFYLMFAISNAMMPSASDRKAWPAFLAIAAVILVVLFLIGLQDALLSGLIGPVTAVLSYLGLAFSLTIGVNTAVIMLIMLVEQIISMVRGVEVVYSDEQPEQS